MGCKREFRCDRHDDGDGAVPIPDVVLDDQRRPGLPDLGAPSGIELDQMDFAAARETHFRLVFEVGFVAREVSNFLDASCSSGNHSAAIERSRPAFARYPASSRWLRFFFPRLSTKCHTAWSMNRLRVPFVVTRSRTLTVVSCRTT